MNKKAKYTINGALIGGGLGFIKSVIEQLYAIEDGTQEKFDWNQAFKTGGIGALIGGTSGFVCGAIMDHQNSKEIPVNTDLILNNYANDIKLKKDNPEFLYTNMLAKRLEDILYDEFYDELSDKPERLGSTLKGTALNDQFDIDVALAFHPRSFISTEEMNNEVYDYLIGLKNDGVVSDVRLQKRSIGVYMRSGIQKLVKVDVVPYKLTDNVRSQGYLSVKRKNIFGGTDFSFQKTDIEVLNSIRLSNTQKNIIVILKKWKTEKGIPLSSNLLQNLVLDAYKSNKGRIPRGFTEKIIMVLRHIAENLEDLNLVGIENTNNIITDISDDKKSDIIYACKKLIDDYNYQPNLILDLLLV